ncbi:MAG: endo-1,4-beta-xylanase [Candidatus Korobacteraceae bacterium]
MGPPRNNKLGGELVAWGRLLSVAVVVLAWVGLGRAAGADIPLRALHPREVFNLQPTEDATAFPRDVHFPDGSSHPALLLRQQSRVTYDIPIGQSSFRGELYRQDAGDSASDPRNDYNRIRVRFLLDGKEAYDTVLDVTMPPERFAIPVSGAKTLTIAVDQMLSGGAVFLADAVFSSQLEPHAITYHLLPAGAGYANLGANVRQVAFRTYHPGETVPLQMEFSGAAREGSISITIGSNTQANPIALLVPVVLHAGDRGSVGNASWQVPIALGPAQLDLRASVNGKQVYRRTLQISIARQLDVSQDSPSSTFGIHLSSAGIPYLADSVADIWGARWARIFLRWEVVEFERGRYDWRRIDELVDLYLSQHMQILGVLGETAPKWAAPSGAETEAAFNQFVKAAVEHLQNKIRYWDVYNEIDSKYHASMVVDKTDPTADIRLLRDEMNIIRQVQPGAKLVCCSTGTSYWLAYDKRLYDNGLLGMIDILSSHPYQAGPPEQRDGVFDYFEIIARLRKLERAYGADKPVWSTEANWIIGPEGQKGVTAPDVSQHNQSRYLVRVNLLSMALGVPYFVHAPLFTPFHRDLMVDSIASYANMTYNFAGATNARLLKLPEGIYGVAANLGSRTILAVWTTRESATVKLAGMRDLRFQDIYGNSVAYDAARIPLSGDPVYVAGVGDPTISLEQIAPIPAATPLPNPWTWDKSLLQHYRQTESGVRITTRRTNYGDLLTSPAIAVLPNSCYLVSTKIHTSAGGVAMVAADAATGRRLGAALNLFNVTGNDDYEPVLKVRTISTTQIKIVLIADNPNEPQVTEFEVSRPQIRACDGQ